MDATATKPGTRRSLVPWIQSKLWWFPGAVMFRGRPLWGLPIGPQCPPGSPCCAATYGPAQVYTHAGTCEIHTLVHRGGILFHMVTDKAPKSSIHQCNNNYHMRPTLCM